MTDTATDTEKDFRLTIREIIAVEMGIELEEVTENAYLVEDLVMDSLDLVEVQMRMEEEFDITWDDEDWDFDTFKTVGDLTKYVEEKLNK